MISKFILTLVAIASIGTLAACANTVHGAGEDIERAGENIQKNVPPKK
jgi:predicted small secreted protein